MATFGRFVGLATQPLFLENDLTWVVLDVIREVEEFDALVRSRRRLLQQRTTDLATAERRLREIRVRLATLVTKVHTLTDEAGS